MLTTFESEKSGGRPSSAGAAPSRSGETALVMGLRSDGLLKRPCSHIAKIWMVLRLTQALNHGFIGGAEELET
jgi:hypothetical protein